MTLLRRPLPRLVLWAGLLVAAAAAAGWASSSWGVIVAVVFAAWVVVAASERKLSGAWSTHTVAAHVMPAEQSYVIEEPALDDELVLDPEPEPAPVAAEPVEQPHVLSALRRRGPSAPAPPEPVQWSVWMLEETIRDHAPDNDELVFLTASLREYADADGLLPIGFDSLVRESFGSLLSR